jgi:hypothetical protein
VAFIVGFFFSAGRLVFTRPPSAAMVPDAVKKELLQKIRTFLAENQ